MKHILKIFKIVRRLFFGSSARGFVTSYLLFMVIGATFLKLPISLQSGAELSWIDALFVSSSGLSTTGLSTIVVKDTLTVFGQTVLVFIIQFGGIGLIMGVALFWLITRQKIGFKERNMIMQDQNQLTRQGIVRFVRNTLIVIFIVESIAFVVMFLYLYLSGTFPLNEALFQAFFTTISLFVNAGFDIAPGGDSFFMYANDYFMQSLAMFLMFVGAVGFWPLAEVKEWFSSGRNKGEKFKLSMFAKTLVILHLSIWLVSALIVYLLEFNHGFQDAGFIESVYYSLFMSLTTRNAGFSTMAVTDFSHTTQLLFTGLMFIGSSPNSAGGGIRTTTFMVLLLGIISFARGRDDVVFKERTIKQEIVSKSMIVFIMAIMLVGFNLVILSYIEPFTITELAFELTSAFGTTGLSLGITSHLTTAGKAILIMTMFIGRVGILALLLMFKPAKKTTGNVHYPEMDIIVG